MARITMRNSQKATFAEVFEIYISAVTARGVKDKTIATYKQHFHTISKRLDTNGRGSASPVRQFITHIHQELDLLIFHRTIQRHTQPMGFIHMPAGENARFLPEGANQSGITLEVHNTDFTLAGQAQILSGDIHDHGEPFPVPVVPEHQKAGIFGKEMLALNAVGVRQIGS